MIVAGTVTCPLCRSSAFRSGLTCQGVPSLSVVMHRSREEAAGATRGDISLAGCVDCGFVFNASYDSSLQHYGDRYESTQSCSQLFNEFNEQIASEVAASAEAGAIVEIGCGQGEFLSLLEKRGCENLVGFDPAYDSARSAQQGGSGFRVLAQEFASKAILEIPSAIVCKMTLEHIAQPVRMLEEIRELASRSTRCSIFVQVPNAGAIFSLNAFWDVYYEHCNYFTARTLGNALRQAGLEPVSIIPVFSGQYLMARTQLTVTSEPVTPRSGVATELEAFEGFSRDAGEHARAWRSRIGKLIAAGERIALWGGGSKAVAFLSFTETETELLAAIDINPRKTGTFLPGSGLSVVSPEQAKELGPTVIVLLNSIYRSEVMRQCSLLRIDPSIVELNT